MSVPNQQYIVRAAPGGFRILRVGMQGPAGPAGAGGSYTLPVATTTILGGVKQGSGVAIAVDGTLTVTAGGIGTVTSVGLSGGTTGLTATGSPITTAGTLTLAGTLAIANGGTGAITAAGALAALGTDAAGTQRPPAAHTQAFSTITATPTTLAGYGINDAVTAAQVGAVNGVATLDGAGKLTAAQLPDLAISAYLGSVASQAAMLALVGQRGDWCVRSDLGTNFVLNADTPTLLASWTQLSYPAASVTSVAGRTGAITLTNTDVGGLGTLATLNAAPAGTLTGTTLNATVTASSLTSAAGGTFGTGAFAPVYSLPIASTTVLGGVKQGSGTSIAADGTISVVSGGTGTVTSVSVTTTNGVSGTVATATTTPAITITLGAVTPTSVAAVGTVTGSNLSGVNTGDQTSVSGNAGTATALQTTRAINGVFFNGTADITVPAAAGTLTGAALAGTVVASSLTTVGTLTGGSTGAGFTVALSVATVTGTLAIANGGTNATTARGARDNLGLLTLTTLGTIGAVTVDLATAARFLLAPTGNVTISLANDADGVSWLIFVRASAFAVTWMAGVKWTGGVAPTLPTIAGRVMKVAFTRLSPGEYDGTASGESF